ncbi:hypothetical protein Fmac_031313 [Flemingia macrophylla]|uniref:UDP-glycosyltransferase n=1 Tax=Flemingia macrophylla TaxID=520843 RepID=A0ABD1L1R8_9FABA
MRVLQHPAIGGFRSHCGWNSTRDVFNAVPFLASPIAMDQPLNSKYIAEDWKVGWRVKTEIEQGILIKRDEIASLLKKFMDLDSDEVRDMRERVKQLQQLCQNSIACGGSSETNLNVFLGHILLVDKPYNKSMF